jgi:hypothetical protein
MDRKGNVMRYSLLATVVLVVLFSASSAPAQRTEITITLSEQFFDTLLDSIFQNSGPPEFSIASSGIGGRRSAYGVNAAAQPFAGRPQVCKETIRLLRENDGVRTAVRFRDGRILAPLAFSGGYSPPFVGCVDFAGWAETNIDLEFDQANQRLVARARVVNVSLNGTGGAGGTVIAKMIQTAIDKKVNPIELMKLDKISFTVPIQNTGSLRMKAVGVRNDISNGALNVHVAYEFLRG